ncbi:MAG TPA: MXAN_2562 family outer membrane beta-barrel protein [Polyangiaceae bacterium]
MKKVWFASAALVLATLPASARAEESDFAKPPAPSPQWFAIEFRFAPYWPAIDTQPGLTGSPYKTLFGTMPRLLASFELDAQVLKIPHFGSLGPAFSFGYTEMSAPAPITGGGGKLSEEDTNIEVFPMYLAAVLRIDVLLRDFKIPIVPYAKLGVATTLWRVFTDSGTSTFDGKTGFGATWGEQFALGGMLNLDWIDPRAAHELDNATGINHTYLFAEWMLANLDNFGSSSGLRVGTNTVAAGLAFEF